jgi:putative ABC transport system ATP-binding protein
MVSPGSAVAARGLTKSFGTGAARVEALRGIDLTIAPGEFVAVMGASGSGKSSLLHLLAGLELPTSGTVHVGGVEITSLGDDERTLLRRRRVGVIFQAFHLLDVLSAEENVALPLAIGGCGSKRARARAGAALERVGLAHRRRHLPRELSGGEQQRVAIARALVIDPVLLLADEPTGNLDTANSRQVLTLLRELVDRSGHTLLLVTHDPAQAALADRLIRLRDGAVCAEERCGRARPPDHGSGAPHDPVDLCAPRTPAPARPDAAHAPGHCHWSGDRGGDPGHRPHGHQRLP